MRRLWLKLARWCSARGKREPKHSFSAVKRPAQQKLAIQTSPVRASAFGLLSDFGLRPSAFRPLVRRAGFSLIEFVGVLAILAVIASTLIPLAVRRVDKTAVAQEINYLSAVSNALILQFQRSNSIPIQTNWASVVANWTGRSTSQVATNDRNFARLFFYDGSGFLSTNVAYTQNTSGAGPTAPVRTRVAIVSTVAKALPNVNGSLSAADFNSIWNDLPSRTPSYLTSQGWTGNSYDLIIQRVSFDPLFHHLILVNRDASSAPAFTINSTNFGDTVAVTRGALGLNSYFMDGTVVGLWNGNTLTNSFVLNSDISFTFDGGMWRAQLTGASTDNSSLSTNFAYQASLFIGTANVPGGHQGSDTQGALSAFYDFMYAYTVWANECPHFQTASSSATRQADYQILSTLGDNNAIIDSTTASTGGGLLK